MDKIQAYIGDPPEPTCFIDDVIEIDYFVKALETRLKYCPGQNVCILISAESTRRIVKALKERKAVIRCKDCKHRGKTEKCVLAAISEEKEYPLPLFILDNRGEWFCADGVAKDINVPDKEGR